MSDSDLDEDLLALAGVGGSDSEGEDSEEVEVSKKRSSSFKKSSTSKRRKGNDFDDDDDEDDEGDDDDTEKNPYPLEGKYVDYEDKSRIEAMGEIEREELLYARDQEMAKYKERLYLQQRAARGKNQVQKERSGRAEKVKESSRSKKSSKLSELKKQRDKKARRDAGDSYSEDEDEPEEDDYVVPDAESEDDDYEVKENSDEDDYNPDQLEWGSSRTSEFQREASLEEINKIRMVRGQVVKYLYYPEFGEIIKDCFARFHIGVNRATNRPTYRMVRIISIEQGRRPYKLEKNYVNLYAVCSVGKGDPKKVSMDFFSNSPITNEEFAIYKSYAQVPTAKKVEKKFSALKQMTNRVLSSQEVKKIAEKKQYFNRDYVGANAVARRTALEAKLVVAKQQGKIEEVQKIERELEKYQTARQKQDDRNSKFDRLGSLDIVNERNRRRNQEAVRQAELISADKRRKEALAVANGKAISNPFNRLKTNVRLYYQNIQQEEAEKHAQEVKDQEADKLKKENLQKKYFARAKYRQAGQLDNVIKSSVDVNLVF